MTKMTSTPKSEESVGGGLYIDHRGKRKSYVWRGRVAGKTGRKVVVRPETGETASVENTTLTDARRFSLAMSADAANGGKDYFAHIAAKPKAGDLTVADAWKAYMLHEGNHLKKRTADNKVSHFTRFIEPRWGTKPVRSITTKGEIRREFEAKGLVGAQVNVLHSNLGQFFRFCAKRDEYRVETNPMLPLDERPVNESLTRRRSRFLEEIELKWFFQAADSLSRLGRRRAVEATEFLLRSCCRRNEVFLAKWSWLRNDGMLVPADMAKNGCSILVPLTDTMRALIGERPAVAKDDDTIFGMSVSWLSRAIEEIRHIMDEISGVDDSFSAKHGARYFTLHDFRDTMLTLMEEPQNEWHQPIFPLETRDGLLNHRPSGVGAKRYHGRIHDPRWLYAQRKAAGAYWDNWLSRLKAEALALAVNAA
jgi:integrase